MASEVSTAAAQQDLRRRVAELERELAEAGDHRIATSEILGVISRSPTDLNAVLDVVAGTAARLCEAEDVSIIRKDAQVLRVPAFRGASQLRDFEGVPLNRDSVAGRAILDRQLVHVHDITEEPEDEFPISKAFAKQVGHRTMLAVPLLSQGDATGAIFVRRTEVRPFSDSQIDLLKTFANQAVIALENTRLFEAEQASKRELQESLHQQIATADVLKVISRATFDLPKVLDTLVESAARLCEADMALILRPRDAGYYVAAKYGFSPEYIEYHKTITFPPGRGSLTGRVLLEGMPVQIPDVLADPEYNIPESQRLGGYRTHLGVPLLRGGNQIGVILVSRRTVRPFDNKQIELVTTFADQAVIAIENTRLFEAEQASKRELQESLEYQTATSEVLSIISRSPSQIQPVLFAIAETAGRLCRTENTAIWLLAGDAFQLAAHTTSNVSFAKYLAENPLPTGSDSLAGRVVLARRTMHVPDVLADPILSTRPQFIRGKTRTALGVPLLRDGAPSGVIVLTRPIVLPFTDKQIELVKTFADQAVIAIENVRLFEAEQDSKRELQETLEQQIATADVLKVISRSALDLQRVLDALVESAARLCDAYDAAIFQLFGDSLRLVAHYGQIPTPGPVGQHTMPLVRGLLAGRVVLDRRTIQVADMLAEKDEYPEGRRIALQMGYRTALCVPLVHTGEAIGVILIRRGEVRPFTDRQIELVNTFADQAVIAIENTRLFNEIAQKSRELEIASQHKSQFVANMSHELRTPLAAMLGYAELLQEGIYGAPPEKFLPILTRIRSNGKHLLGLINTVLDISKIEAGQFKLNLGEYALGSIIETVMLATESLAATKKLTFKTEVAKGLPYGLGDEQRLTQVLLNLVGNAIKFTDAGEVRIAAGAANSHFAVSISDTGPGIPAEECERIFEKFRQVDSSNTRAKGGTGLGLAIAKEIVEMHGGRIWVESTLGQGSTFRMQLPVRAAGAGAA